jgi:hypothetical protein
MLLLIINSTEWRKREVPDKEPGLEEVLLALCFLLRSVELAIIVVNVDQIEYLEANLHRLLAHIEAIAEAFDSAPGNPTILSHSVS